MLESANRVGSQSCGMHKITRVGRSMLNSIASSAARDLMHACCAIGVT